MSKLKFSHLSVRIIEIQKHRKGYLFDFLKEIPLNLVSVASRMVLCVDFSFYFMIHVPFMLMLIPHWNLLVCLAYIGSSRGIAGDIVGALLFKINFVFWVFYCVYDLVELLCSWDVMFAEKPRKKIGLKYQSNYSFT